MGYIPFRSALISTFFPIEFVFSDKCENGAKFVFHLGYPAYIPNLLPSGPKPSLQKCPAGLSAPKSSDPTNLRLTSCPEPRPPLDPAKQASGTGSRRPPPASRTRSRRPAPQTAGAPCARRSRLCCTPAPPPARPPPHPLTTTVPRHCPPAPLATARAAHQSPPGTGASCYQRRRRWPEELLLLDRRVGTRPRVCATL
jgi:hypothetical protein